MESAYSYNRYLYEKKMRELNGHVSSLSLLSD